MNLTEIQKEDLKSLLQYNFEKAVEGREEKIERFKKSYQYYMCLAPEKDEREISGYVEPVVRKAVEAIKPSLMNIFTENEKKAVKFRPNFIVNPQMAEMIDTRINDIFLRENDGYDIAERAITEALVSGDVFVKTFIEDFEIEEEFDLERVPMEVLQAILTDFPDTHDEKLKEDMTKHRDGTVTVKFKAEKYDKRVVVEFIPFSEVFVSGDAEDIRDVRYMCHRIGKTVGQLIKMGYDEECVKNASTANGDDASISLHKIVNTHKFASDVDDDDSKFADPMERQVYMYEHYIYTSVLRSGKKNKHAKLYKVIATNKDILDVEECEYIPFTHGVSERIPGSFWGVSFYDKFGPAQDIISRMVRTLEYNAAAGTYQRYIAIKGEYDRASLLNNRPGGVIEVNVPNAVQPFVMPTVDAPVLELMNRIQNTANEDRQSLVGVDVTGANMSATAAAITANSADLRDKVIARVLAYTLFRPLFESIYNIIRQEDLEVGEIPGPIDPQSGQQMPPVKITGIKLPAYYEFQVDVNTSNDDGILAQQLVQLATMFSQWAAAPSPIVSPQSMLKIAEQITGLSADEVAEYFQAPQPTPEEQMMTQYQQQDAMETAELNKELLRAQVANAAALTIKTEQEIAEMIADGEAKRKREEEKSLQAFKKLELQEFELSQEAATGRNLSASV